ncbi:Flp pilus assembly protein TadD, contains TPR repeats [Hartmannibacter diazotrophicus]|uniref:Flp pilus assembly protein TadD, contains TPR repeats n=1 Tax=Hartmannibacter diazotrophicus TaxID=1482074 RepID=A0A2C9D7U6_9HYPH|nr:tetratricopeptide repeat protein [Hartmannibacter diazotrophicus]SON56392.1 Flp pilus assembly protein TadD, contains TPR repeats [Hartmannibacter diazotrophicus]
MFPAYSSIGLSLIISIVACVHVVRTGREYYWLLLILIFQPLGAIIYSVAIVLPELFGGGRAQRAGRALSAQLDPAGAYRQAARAVDDNPSVYNRIQLATAAFDLGRYEEAERLYRESAEGIYADDPALLLGRARALIELKRPQEALELLQRLHDLGEEGRTPQAALALGRAQEALSNLDEAELAYEQAALHLPGLEGMARYAALLSARGREKDAEAVLADMNRRVKGTPSRFRREARAWRDFAASRVREPA